MTKILNYFNDTEGFSLTGFETLIRELKNQRVPVQNPIPPMREAEELLTVPLVQQTPKVQEIPPVQQDTTYDPGTTMLNAGAAPAGGYTQHYVNPNLTHSQSSIPVSGGNIPKTYPGTKQEEFDNVPQPEQQKEEAPVKEKKGIFGRKEKGEKPQKTGLFGKKEKTKSTAVSKEETPNRPKSFHGIAIPGSDVVPQQENTATTATAIPAQNVSIPVHAAQIQNFGDTVDLQSYTNATQHTAAPAAMKNPCLIRKETREQFFLKKEVNRVGEAVKMWMFILRIIQVSDGYMRSYICETDGSLWKIRTPEMELS